MSARPAESAKIMKRELQKRFPATKFSTRLSRGTGYGNCHVSWTDGPSVKLVKEMTTPFEGRGFDGMIDCEYHINTRMPDGRESGLGLILEQRQISPQFARQIATAIARFYGIALPDIQDADGGYYQISDTNPNVAGTGLDWYTIIHRASSDRASVHPETP